MTKADVFNRRTGKKRPASEVKMFTIDLNMSLMLGGAVINTVASQQQGLRFESPGDRGAFLCLHVVCVASLRVPRPPPEVQRHAFEGMNWLF